MACAVAIEFLREEKKLLKHVRTMGKYFHGALQSLDKKHKSVLDVRGAGLMQALELDSSDLAKTVAKELLREGIIINRTHETVLRFLPPYVIQKKHVDEVAGGASGGSFTGKAATAQETAHRRSQHKG